MTQEILKEKIPTEEELKAKEALLQKKIEKALHSRNFEKWGLDMNPIVSIGSGLIILVFCILSLVNLDATQGILEQIKNAILSRFDWLFILSSNMFLIICLILAFSKFGNVRLGGVDATPRFSNFAWYSMLISAGMGIGLMFYGVGEPLIHSSVTPPIYTNGDSITQALATTYLHWGIHPWAIYAIVALALAFYAFNRKLPLSLRSVFYPIFKERVFGLLGDIIDILTVIACLFGLASSLGIGAQQLNSGLNYVTGIPYNTTVQVLLIVGITGIATLSVVTGLDKGVKILSTLNIKLAFGFMVCVFLLGPTKHILEILLNSVGLYFNDFIQTSLYIGYTEDVTKWQGEWSIFLLAWWISWSPFVGMFIARISKGRTVREFILAVVVIPSFMTFIWMSVFGGTAASINALTGGKLFEVVQNNLPVAMFEMITHLQSPYFMQIIQTLLAIMALFLILSFFVTSSDSGSLVVDNITSGGKLDSPVPQRIFWACMEGVLAAVLLTIGGPQILNVLQTAIITTGLPFAIILSVMAITLVLEIRKAYTRQHNIKSYRLYKRMDARATQEKIKNLEAIDAKIQENEEKKRIRKTEKNIKSRSV